MNVVNSYPNLGIYGIEDAENKDVNHKIEQDSYDHESKPQRAQNGVILLEDIALFSYSIEDYTFMLREKADKLNKLGKGLVEEIISDYAVTTLRSRRVLTCAFVPGHQFARDMNPHTP